MYHINSAYHNYYHNDRLNYYILVFLKYPDTGNTEIRCVMSSAFIALKNIAIKSRILCLFVSVTATIQHKTRQHFDATQSVWLSLCILQHLHCCLKMLRPVLFNFVAWMFNQVWFQWNIFATFLCLFNPV